MVYKWCTCTGVHFILSGNLGLLVWLLKGAVVGGMCRGFESVGELMTSL